MKNNSARLSSERASQGYNYGKRFDLEQSELFDVIKR
jgi:hypothetical protein